MDNLSFNLSRIKHPVDKNSLIIFFIFIFNFFINLLLFCFFLLFYLIILPVILIAKFFSSLCNGFIRHVKLNISEELWAEHCQQVTQSLVVVEGRLEVDEVLILFQDKLNSDSGLIAHLKKRLTFVNGMRIWKSTTKLSLNNHIFSSNELPFSATNLYKYLASSSFQPLSLDFPPWQIFVQNSSEETLLLFRCHAALLDGVNIAQLFSEVFSSQKITLKSRFGQKHKCSAFLKSFLLAPNFLLKNLFFIDSDDNSFKREQFTGPVQLASSEPFPLQLALRMKLVSRCTLNDILLTVATGSIRKQMQLNGSWNPTEIQAAVPVDIRNSSQNETAWVHIALPTDIEGVIPRLWKIKHRMEKMKNSSTANLSFFSYRVLNALLPKSTFFSLRSSWFGKCSCLIANVPGPTQCIDIKNHPVRMIIGWSPLLVNIPFTLTFTVYHDAIRMVCLTNGKCPANPNILTDYFTSEMNTLARLLANRKVPGEKRSSLSQQQLHSQIFRWPNERSLDEIKKAVLDVQKQLQEIKSGEQTSDIENKVEYLKEQFKELISEMRRRRENDDDEADDNDGELRRSSFRGRATSGVSRGSVISIISVGRAKTSSMD